MIPNVRGILPSEDAFSGEVVTRAIVRDVDLGPDAGLLALITLDNGHDHTKPNTFGVRGLLSLNDALDGIAARVARGEVAAVGVTGKPFILAFWHGRLLMIPMAWQNLAPMHMLISGHRDGRIIADAVRYFGIDSIAGSSNAGGGAALRAMVRHVRHGDCVGITPDGPDGPAMRAKPGPMRTPRPGCASLTKSSVARAATMRCTVERARPVSRAIWPRLNPSGRPSRALSTLAARAMT